MTLAALITMLLMVLWEIEMRHLGLQVGDLDDGRGYWTVERRRVDSGPRDSVVIVGDSRILFDTDLATWEKLTNTVPIQLGLMGTNAQLILHDLAQDTPCLKGRVGCRRVVKRKMRDRRDSETR